MDEDSEYTAGPSVDDGPKGMLPCISLANNARSLDCV